MVVDRNMLEFFRCFLINFNQWKCACVGINNWVILLRARYKCNQDEEKFLLLEFGVCSVSPEVNERRQWHLLQEVNFVELSFVVADNSVLFCLAIIVRISSGSRIIPGGA